MVGAWRRPLSRCRGLTVPKVPRVNAARFGDVIVKALRIAATPELIAELNGTRPREGLAQPVSRFAPLKAWAIRTTSRLGLLTLSL